MCYIVHAVLMIEVSACALVGLTTRSVKRSCAESAEHSFSVSADHWKGRYEKQKMLEGGPSIWRE